MTRFTPDRARTPGTALPRAARVLAAAVAVGALAACSGSGDGSPLPAQRDDQVALSASTDSAMVEGQSAEDVTARVSASLFESAPAAILVDSTGLEGLAATATEAGIPVLAISDDQTGTNLGSPAPSPDAGPLDAELDRLGAETVLALGPRATEVAGGLGVEVVAEAGQLPDITPAERESNALLVTAHPATSGLDDTTTAAVEATAGAARAAYVRVASGDPRETEESVTTIAEAKPERTVGVGAGLGSPEQLASRVATAATGVQLPGGGQLPAAEKLYVALYGHPGAGVLGVLGEQDLDGSVERAREHAAPYEDLTDKQVLPMFEIITTVALGDPSPNGNYTNEVDPEFLRPWVERAGEEGIYVVLDLQPGRADLLDQAQKYESLLSLPHVGLAIDPEWKLKPDQRPLQVIGGVQAEEINRVSDWLAGLTRENNLPQKLLVLHQFRLDMLPDRENIKTDHDELQVLIHVDGQGGQGAKQGTWSVMRQDPPENVVWGWKNFYDEDQPMLTPSQTIDQVDPTPVMISYQ